MYRIYNTLAHCGGKKHARIGSGCRSGSNFGGIARLEQGFLPGRDVLCEHLRIGSRAVILSRTFQGNDMPGSLESGIAALRDAEKLLSLRSPWQIEADRIRISTRIAQVAAEMSSGPTP